LLRSSEKGAEPAAGGWPAAAASTAEPSVVVVELSVVVDVTDESRVVSAVVVCGVGTLEVVTGAVVGGDVGEVVPELGLVVVVDGIVVVVEVVVVDVVVGGEVVGAEVSVVLSVTS
jgi:hypothetical protein